VEGPGTGRRTVGQGVPRARRALESAIVMPDTARIEKGGRRGECIPLATSKRSDAYW
jgi:hypothetical protein